MIRLLLLLAMMITLLWCASCEPNKNKTKNSDRQSAKTTKKSEPTEDLETKLLSDNSFKQVKALMKITEHLNEANEVLPILRRLLVESKSKDVRQWAAIAIGAMGNSAISAEPEIMTKLTEYEAYEFVAVASAAFQIGVPPEKALPLLREALLHSKHNKAGSARIIGAYNLATPEIVATLASQANFSDSKVREAVAQVLGKMGPEAKPAVPKLAELLWDSDKWVEGYAAKALVKITAEFDDNGLSEHGFHSTKEAPEEFEIVIRARKWWKEKGSTQEWK